MMNIKRKEKLLEVKEYIITLNCQYTSVADLRGGAREAPPLGQNFFIFMQFSGKFGK